MEQHASQGQQQDDWIQGAVVEAQCAIEPERIDVRLDGIEFGTDENVA